MIEKIFTEIDDFCLHFEPEFNQFLIKLGCKKRNKKETLSISEVATIVVMFHRSGYRYFKDFYIKNVQKNWKKYFPVLVSYNRFVELMPKALFALCSFLKTRFGKPTGISYIDSTSLAVCENSRAKRHKVFKDEAGWGKSSTGWYFGFKLHLIVSDTGELLGAKCTSGNTDDRSVLEEMCSELIGKLFGDRGYISKDKAEMLYEKYGVELITTTKKNMKKKPISLLNKILLRGRSIIETINDQLKKYPTGRTLQAPFKDQLYGEFSVRFSCLYVPREEAIPWYTSHWSGSTGCINSPPYVELRYRLRVTIQHPSYKSGIF